MSSTVMADYPYDFSAFTNFFQNSSVQDNHFSQSDFEETCTKLDDLLRSGQCSLPFMEIYFYLSFSRRQRQARMERFSYLQPSYIEETVVDHAHLHEVYYIGKFYSQSEATRATMTEHLQSVNLRCESSIFRIMNIDTISDFFHIGEEKVDFLQTLSFLKQSGCEAAALCQHVKRLSANYMACKFIFHSIYYISKDMHTTKKDFYSDFLERKRFAEFVSRRFLIFNIFELNYQIVYNFNRYPDLVDSIYQSELKSNSLWNRSYATSYPENTSTFLKEVGIITPFLSPSLRPFQNLHKFLCDRVYSLSVEKEVSTALLLLNFKTYFYRAQFYMQHPLVDVWKDFVSFLREFDKEISYSFRFLSLCTNHLKKYKVME